MRFSLVIPVAPERGAEIIDSIKRLDYPKTDFHVVVVQGRNPSENRNRGFEKASGEYIVFLDDDAVIKEDYLRNIDGFLDRHPEVDVVGGPQLTPESDSGFAKISGYALASKFGAWKLANRYCCTEENCNVDETCLTSANLTVRREVMEKVKFDPNLFPGEDPKFISDSKKNGFKVGYSPKIVIYHRRRPTLKSFVKQIFNYGRVRPKKESFFETLKRPFFLVPSIFFIYLILLIGMVALQPNILGNAIKEIGGLGGAKAVSEDATSNVQITGNVIKTGDVVKIGDDNSVKVSEENFDYRTLLFLPFIAYILLALLFSLYDSAKNRDLKAFFILPFIYLTIHLSYGAGMISGYLRKVI